MKEMRFYWHSDTKTVLLDLGESSSQCRSEGLELLEPNTKDASAEKHLPVCNLKRGYLSVKIGEQDHPMLPEHYIQWVLIQTTTGGVYRKLFPGDQPKVDVPVDRQEVLAVYAYCNLHGLWKMQMYEEKEFHETVCSPEFKDCIES